MLILSSDQTPSFSPPFGGGGNADGRVAIGRILVIDDEESMCQTLATVLTRKGFTVECGTSAAVALRLLEGSDFDVVITDLHMDGMDGIAVCKAVACSHPEIPVVVMTAFGTSESQADARLAGAWGFVTKPFDLELLRATLTQAVQVRRAAAQ